MSTKGQLNVIYEKIAKSLDISDDLFKKAKAKYEDMGSWLDKKTSEYKIDIYPQGSFALGTVIRPYNDKDEYDLDLVCEFKNLNEVNAKKLKIDIVKPLLQEYGDCEEPEEKKRCWQVIYKDCPQFHMDIIPAKINSDYILITDKDEDNKVYEYIGSNPSGYISWFKERMKVRMNILKEQFILKEFVASIDEVPDYKIKTPLQKAIQILKRHRDIMFINDTENTKPISVIITTVAANIYENEDNLYDTLKNILNNAEKYVNDSKLEEEYTISNPSNTGNELENFADKWRKHPERAKAFFEWINKAKEDVIDNPIAFTSNTEVGNVLKFSLGENLVTKSMSMLDVEIGNEMSNILNEGLTIPSQKVVSLLTASHRQKALWTLPNKCAVLLKVVVKDIVGNRSFYKSDDKPIEKNSSIDFTVLTGIKKPFKAYWQVVNTGREAYVNGCLRGGFYASNIGETTTHETIAYTGSHYIQCFIIKNGQCVGKSKEFIVNVE